MPARQSAALDELVDIASEVNRPREGLAASPERTALGAAIGRRDAEQRRLATVREVRESAVRRAIDLRPALGAAQAAVEVAKAGAADRLVAAALGEATTPAQSIADALAEVERIEGELTANGDAQTLLAKRQAEIEKQLPFLQATVERRVNDVLATAPIIARLAVDFEAALARVNDLRGIIGSCIARGYLAPGSWMNDDNPAWPMPLTDAWRHAADALERDASAPLPES